MIPTKPRRSKAPKLPKILERQYKQTKCRDCTVVVNRMDFAKILGKFTKVKIQFESNVTPKTRRTIDTSLNSRKGKGNENGMVQVHRSAYNPHPARKLLGLGKKTKINENVSPRQASNVLKDNNRLKKTLKKDPEHTEKKTDIADNSTEKQYGIVFVSPSSTKTEIKSKISLDNLLPSIDKNVLPSENWFIDYFPKKGEPKDDKIYDRIAAELEDLMYSEKTKNISNNKDDKNDEFPSILDILNDTSKEGTDKTSEHSSPVESSDVEAMLLGKSKPSVSIPMVIDNPVVSSVQLKSDSTSETAIDDNPNSPSILDEPELKEVPVLSVAEKPLDRISNDLLNATSQSMQIDENDNTNAKNNNSLKAGVTQVIFKKTINGTSSKTVICPKNLTYSISIQGKSIQLLGAPKVISSLEDLKVLLQIVEETELDSLYLFH